MTSSPNPVCSKCGHDGFTVAFLSPAEYAAPGQPRQMNIPPSTAMEVTAADERQRVTTFLDNHDSRIERIEEGYAAMQRTSARELSEQVARNVGFDRRLEALKKKIGEKQFIDERRSEMQTTLHRFRLDRCAERIEKLESTVGKIAERIEALEAKHQRLSDGLGGFTSEINHIGTRQFDAGRRLEIVSESCAVARKDVRALFWYVVLLAVVVAGLIVGLVLGKAG